LDTCLKSGNILRKAILSLIAEFGKIEKIYNRFIEEHPHQKDAYWALPGLQ
jgi:hypothetical protein